MRFRRKPVPEVVEEPRDLVAGDIVWQHKHAPDGYRFEVVGSRQVKQETVVLCRPFRDADGLELHAFAPPRDREAYILMAGDVQFPPGGTMPVDLPIMEIRASALALAED